MLKRTIVCLTFITILFAGQARARAQDGAPTILIQVRSLAAVMENVKLLVTLSGREAISKQVEELVKSKIGANGLEGIDPARPFGVYGTLKSINDGTVVLLVPIADENAFLKLLKNLNYEAKKNANTGIYTISGLPVEIYFRFSEKYAYVSTLNLDALGANNLLPPAKVFRADQKSAISVALRLDQLPKDVKFEFLAQLEQGIKDAQNVKIPDETPAQNALRLQVSREIVDQFKAVLNEGKQLGMDLNVDKNAEEISLTFSVTAQPNTALARNIAEVGKTKSLFANLRTRDCALHGSATMALPQSLQKLFADTIDEAQAKILAGFDNAARRKQAEELLKGLAPTFKAAALDAAFSIQGPNAKKQYNIIAGVKLHEGANLNKTLRNLLVDVRENMKPAEKDLLQLDVDNIAGATIHRFDLRNFYGDDKEAKEILGDGPIVMAVRDDLWCLAVGPDAMLTLRKALTKTDDAPVPPLAVEFSLARLWPLLPANDKNRAKLQELYPPGNEGGLRFSVDGGSSLNVRVSAHLSLVRFLGLTTMEMK
jgi:hypothetical protein